ncbi:dehydrogenase [Mameliella alba]|nr:dehydrogenase [Mameliella alba]GGF74799.1 dehydrogenase [Mameliella alba]
MSDLKADFVIVGGGSAGCVLANRLSAGGQFSVILVEAGRASRPLMSKVPLGVGRAWSDPRHNWNDHSAPEPGLDGRHLTLTRGRLLGGSGAINAMNFVRGAAADFDAWHSLGLPGWSAEEMARHFRATERTTAGLSSPTRGDSGPIDVAETPVRDGLIEAWMKALQGQGVKRLDDYNADLTAGVGRAQFNIARGRRRDPRVAYLDPACRRKNLRVLGEHHALRITVRDGRAADVLARYRGVLRRIAARREVIVAAGSYGSPHLLQLSGIGPGATLQAAGIPPVMVNDRIGCNLWDHPRVAIEYARCPSYMHRLLRWDRLLFRFAQALVLRSGPATWPLAAAHLFMVSSPARNSPDMQVLLRLFDPTLQPWLLKAPDGDRWGMVVCLVQPESRGHVRTLSDDPAQAPEVVTGILSEESDMARMVATCEALRQAMRVPEMTRWASEELSPGPSVSTKADWRDFMRKSSGTIFHPGGTCAMGEVVDHRLRLRGVAGLRVVDASVMPLPVTGNIHAAVLAVAEKAAGMIRQDAR